jgi:hypothetical protein
MEAQEILFRSDVAASGNDIMGIGVSASVATSRDRQGSERAHVAIRQGQRLYVVAAEFEKSGADRARQGRICDLVAVLAICAVAGVPVPELPLDVRLRGAGIEQTATGFMVTPSELDYVLPELDSQVALVSRAGEIGGLPEGFRGGAPLVFPGSFNPLHFGHEEIARAAETASGRRVFFEMTAQNADKAAIDTSELARRLIQFRGRWPVLLSDEPRFIEKARQYGCDFVIGADTAHRLFDEKFLKRGETVSGIMAEFRMLRTRFWLAGRAGAAAVPENYRDLFVQLPGRWEVSSTDIREAKGSQ